MSSLPSVAVVILNWNGKHYLEKFLPSVLNSTYSNMRVIVADNASTDDSILVLRNAFPQIEVIQLKKNFGFAKGYNEALKFVESDYYLLLNSDVEVKQSWIEPMVHLLQSNDLNAACQPKILSHQNKEWFDYAGAAGGWLDIYGYPFARGRVFDVCEKDQGQYDTTTEVFWASGAALLIKRTLYRKMNGLDEYFFAHQEEIDLCWRLKLEGYKIFCCPQSVVYHLGGGTLPKGDSIKTFLNFRNNQIMLAKNLSWSEKLWKIPYRLALDQLSAVKGLINGEFGYFRIIIKAHLHFFHWLIFQPKRFKQYNTGLKHLTAVYHRNVVWQYFLRKRQTFNDIVKRSRRGSI